MRRLVTTAALAVIVAAATAVWAAAEGGDGGPPTISGCLAANGDFRDFAVGGAPAKACKASDTQIQLSGGDVTSVVAGAGLEGGALAGAATVGIAERFRLPEGCATGDSPRWQEGRWVCSSPLPLTNHTVFRRVPFVLTAHAPDPLQTVMTLRLPPGKYEVSTHVFVGSTATGTFSHIRCTTSPSVGAPASGIVLTDMNIGNTPGSIGAGTLSGTSPETVAEGASIQLQCGSLAGFGALPTIHWAVISATPIDAIVVSEDTTTG
jgi:hypothetical protein